MPGHDSEEDKGNDLDDNENDDELGAHSEAEAVYELFDGTTNGAKYFFHHFLFNPEKIFKKPFNCVPQAAEKSGIAHAVQLL
jgi:hypothetical protein